MENKHFPDIYTSGVDGIERGRLVNLMIPAVDLDLITAIALINNVSLGDEIVKAIQEYILNWYESSD